MRSDTERGGGRVGGCGEWKTAEVVRGRVTRRRPRSGSTWLDRRDSNRPEREKGGRAEESREKRVIEGISHLPSNQRIDDQSKTNYHPRGVSKTSRLAVGVEGIRSVLEFVSRIGKERRSDFFRTILFPFPPPATRLYPSLSPPGLSTRIDDDSRIDEATSPPSSPRPVPIVITHRCDRKSTVKLQERSIYQSTSAPIWW